MLYSLTRSASHIHRHRHVARSLLEHYYTMGWIRSTSAHNSQWTHRKVLFRRMQRANAAHTYRELLCLGLTFNTHTTRTKTKDVCVCARVFASGAVWRNGETVRRSRKRLDVSAHTFDNNVCVPLFVASRLPTTGRISSGRVWGVRCVLYVVFCLPLRLTATIELTIRYSRYGTRTQANFARLANNVRSCVRVQCPNGDPNAQDVWEHGGPLALVILDAAVAAAVTLY